MTKTLIDRALLEQALETLEKAVSTCFDRRAHEQVMSSPAHFINLTITALRAALAQEEQPEQEPVAWMRPNETLCVVREVAEAEGYQPLYTHPPRREWKGLSKDEALKLWGMRSDGPSNTEITSFASAIEQALKERNHD